MFCSKKSGCCESVLSWAVKFSKRTVGTIAPGQIYWDSSALDCTKGYIGDNKIFGTTFGTDQSWVAGGGGSYNCKIVEIIHGTNINNIFSQPFTLLLK